MLAMLSVVLVQLAIWLSVMYLVLEQRQFIIELAGSFSLPTAFYFWAILFLIAGYMMYGAFLAAAGALSSTPRETQQIIWVLIIPLMPTLIFASEFASDPPSALSVALSLFPLTAPSAMVTRIATGNAPLWQILLSLAGVMVTAYLALAAAARFYRPDTFLSLEAFSWKRFASEWRRK
jgi:ABC-2 type transport system permease protein